MHAVTTCTVGHFHRPGLLGEAVIAILKTPEPVTGETELLGELDRGMAGGTDLRRYIARSYRRASVFGRKDVVFSMAVGTGRRRDNPAPECGAMDAIVILLADGRMALRAGVCDIGLGNGRGRIRSLLHVVTAVTISARRC